MQTEAGSMNMVDLSQEKAKVLFLSALIRKYGHVLFECYAAN